MESISAFEVRFEILTRSLKNRKWYSWLCVVAVCANWSPPTEHESPSNKCEGNYDAHCTVGVVIGLRICQCRVQAA